MLRPLIIAFGCFLVSSNASNAYKTDPDSCSGAQAEYIASAMSEASAIARVVDYRLSLNPVSEKTRAIFAILFRRAAVPRVAGKLMEKTILITNS